MSEASDRPCGAERGMYNFRGECWTCGWLRRDVDHCYLRNCDRCHSTTDPCSVDNAINGRPEPTTMTRRRRTG